jgi:ERCC4-type nuclease
MLTIKIDTREELLYGKLQILYPSLNIEKEQLNLGDILIQSENGRTLVVERKTINDLSASVKDGRYREQKYRLLREYPREDVLYLIEGHWHMIADEMLKSAVLNTLLRDDIKVFFTSNIEGTVHLINDIAVRISKYAGGSSGTNDYSAVANSSKHTKAEYMTPEVFQTMALCQIPRVSAGIAKSIIDHYGSLSETIMKANKDELAELRINNRRLGMKLAQRICTYIKN